MNNAEEFSHFEWIIISVAHLVGRDSAARKMNRINAMVKDTVDPVILKQAINWTIISTITIHHILTKGTDQE